MDGEDLVCYDESGEALPNYVGMTEARAEAEARAAAEAQALATAEERIRQLEAELQRRTR